MRSVDCKQIPREAKLRFVPESAILLLSLIFLAVFDSTNKHLKHCAAQNRSKNRQFCRIRNRICGIQNNLCNSQTINTTFV